MLIRDQRLLPSFRGVAGGTGWPRRGRARSPAATEPATGGDPGRPPAAREATGGDEKRLARRPQETRALASRDAMSSDELDVRCSMCGKLLAKARDGLLVI